MTAALFLRKYYLKAPVVITGAASYWPALDRWRRSLLMERWTHQRRVLGST
jgi:hypothetical protein